MAADASAFAVLGLAPGADMEAVERAYKSLIKKHHPDRAGGDAFAAAEITRAYRELRAAAAWRHDLVLEPDDEQRERRWSRLALALAILVVALVGVAAPLAGMLQGRGDRPAKALAGFSSDAARSSDAMDRPLSAGAIAAAIETAEHLARTSDEMGMARASSECHHAMRSSPSLAQLDRCAAFDDAVVELQDRDPLRDSGPFSELAVTGRQMSGGSLLSSDYLAIDGRLDRIRLEVELAMAPPEPRIPPPPQQQPQPDSD